MQSQLRGRGQVRTPNACVPSLEELSADFKERADGGVRVYGRTWRVTHPIAALGMGTRPAL